MLENGSFFGRLHVVGHEIRTNRIGKRRRFYRCECACGGVTWAPEFALTSGNTTTCGCLQREVAAARLRTHGESSGGRRTPEYLVWSGMLRRCRNEADGSFKDYGARGIGVCDRWLTFANFVEDMGRRPSPKYTLERRDNDKGYGPDNCVWATRQSQNRNRRSNVLVEFGGRIMPLVEAAERSGLKPNTVTVRLRRGWTLERALTP